MNFQHKRHGKGIVCYTTLSKNLEDDFGQKYLHFCSPTSSNKTAEKPESTSLVHLSTFLRNQSLSNVYPNFIIALFIAHCAIDTNISEEKIVLLETSEELYYQRSSWSQEYYTIWLFYNTAYRGRDNVFHQL